MMTVQRLLQAAQELADSVQADDVGMMIGGKFIGGNGGLLSRETIAKADAVRRAIYAVTNEKVSENGN